MVRSLLPALKVACSTCFTVWIKTTCSWINILLNFNNYINHCGHVDHSSSEGYRLCMILQRSVTYSELVESLFTIQGIDFPLASSPRDIHYHPKRPDIRKSWTLQVFNSTEGIIVKFHELVCKSSCSLRHFNSYITYTYGDALWCYVRLGYLFQNIHTISVCVFIT